MRTKKITVVLLVSLLMVSMSACNLGDDQRPLTRNYESPDGLGPYTYDDDTYRNGMIYNRYDDNRMNRNDNRIIRNDNRYGYMDNYGPEPYRANQNGNVNGRNVNGRNVNGRNVNQEADKMANLAAKVNGVDDATVVIAGGTAYVALDIDNKVQTKEAANIEQQVYKALKQYTNRFNVNITSDADLFGRLRDIGDGVRDGAPVNRFRTDLRNFDTDNRFNDYR